MNKITIYVLLACLWTVSAVQAQSFGSPAMRKLQMAEFAISNFYVDKVCPPPFAMTMVRVSSDVTCFSMIS